MPQREKTIQNSEKEDFYKDISNSHFSLGDLVVLKTMFLEQLIAEKNIQSQFQDGDKKKKIPSIDSVTTVLKFNKLESPVMVVVEIVKESSKKNQLFNPETGRREKSSIKVLCQWYFSKTATFEQQWFDINVLELLKDNSDNKLGTPTLHETVALKNRSYYSGLINKLDKLARPITSDDKVIRKIFDFTNFTAPYMVVTSIEKTKDPVLLYDKHTGKRKRFASNIRVKCIWYNQVKGRFSESFFIPEALITVKAKSKKELDYESFF